MSDEPHREHACSALRARRLAFVEADELDRGRCEVIGRATYHVICSSQAAFLKNLRQMGEPRVHRHACDFTGRPLPRSARSIGTVPRAGEATASASAPPLSVVCTGSKHCIDASYIFISQRAVGCVSALPGRAARGPSGPRAAHRATEPAANRDVACWAADSPCNAMACRANPERNLSDQ